MSADKMEMDTYEPDYSSACMNCGHTPVVTASYKGKIVHSWDMCGVCTFGTAKALDPDWWNNGE